MHFNPKIINGKPLVKLGEAAVLKIQECLKDSSHRVVLKNKQ